MNKKNINFAKGKGLKALSEFGRFALTLLVVCLFCSVSVFATGAGDIDFSPMVDMLYGVMKAIGVIVAVFGVITFIKGFASDQPESKVQAGMVLAAGLLLYNAQAIIEAMGLSL